VKQGYRNVVSGQQLAEEITAPGRTKPVAVVAWHPDKPDNWIDADHIARELGDLADVYRLENGPESFSFGDHLPFGANVYGNAARVYDPDLEWMNNVYKSPLRMSQSRTQAKAAAENIIEDVLNRVTSIPAPTVAEVAPLREVQGVVKAFVSGGSRAVVELSDGQNCTIQRERVSPPVRLDWMLAVGQGITGILNESDRTLDISELKTVPRLAEIYRPGDLVLALTERVTAKQATLTLFPGSSWPIEADRISSNPLDTVDSLLTEGEVVVVRFLHERGAVVLSLIDVDDDAEVRDAPALLQGGTPWLKADRHLVEQARTGAASVACLADPAAGGNTVTGDLAPGGPVKPSSALLSVQLQLDAARAELARLEGARGTSSQAEAGPEAVQRNVATLEQELELERRQVAAERARNDELSTKNAKQREDLRTLRAANRRAQQALQRATSEALGDFATVEDRFRHELYLAWVKNIPATEKSKYPWPLSYSIGSEFLESLYAHGEPGVLAKALKAGVEILTGSGERSRAREIHPLRAGAGAEAVQVQRPDEAKCFRASIERAVPSARRLHYWKLRDGSIEFSRLVVHDDFRP
jgi:hypothetical protein